MEAPGDRSTRLRAGFAASLGAGLALFALAAAPPASGRAQATFFDASHELRGEHGNGGALSAVRELRALGVDYVRFLVYWREVAPAPDAAAKPEGFDARDSSTYGPNGSGWAVVDRVVRLTREHGMQVQLVPTGRFPTGEVPRWASRDPLGTLSEPIEGEFRDFMHALGARYRGGFDPDGEEGPLAPLPAVASIAVWNEPNNRLFLWHDGVPDLNRAADHYRRLVFAAREGLDDAGWAGQLIAGETSPRPNHNSLDPLRFSRRVLCLSAGGSRISPACAPLPVFGWSHHPYFVGEPPFARPKGPGHISLTRIGRIVSLLAQAHRAGAIADGPFSYIPLLITEFGTVTQPTLRGATPLQQAEFNAIGEYLAWRQPTIVGWGQYLLRDDPPSYGRPFRSGLRPWDDSMNGCYAPGSRCKPSYEAFRMPLVARIARSACFRRLRRRCPPARRYSRSAAIWGHIRPGGDVSAQIVARDRPTRRRGKRRPARIQLVASVVADQAGYFTLRVPYRRGRRYRVRWHGMEGPFIRAYAFKPR